MWTLPTQTTKLYKLRWFSSYIVNSHIKILAQKVLCLVLSAVRGGTIECDNYFQSVGEMATYEGYKEVLVDKQDKILVIKFCDPKKRNCVNRNGYREIGRAVRQVAQDETVTLVVLTGVGDFFTSGNDLSHAADTQMDIDKYVRESNAIFREMISAFIDCPKVLVALVNGPCIGIGATLVGLCDIAWSSKTAYFITPFTKLGIVPEACSSYLFPLIFGRSKAGEMLLLAERLSAEEAYNYKFVSKLFAPAELDTVIWPKIKEFANLPPGSLQATKSLMRLHERDALYRALNAETEELYKRFYSDEFVNAIIEFTKRKNKSKL